jgi:hypothetical protein
VQEREEIEEQGKVWCGEKVEEVLCDEDGVWGGMGDTGVVEEAREGEDRLGEIVEKIEQQSGDGVG